MGKRVFHNLLQCQGFIEKEECAVDWIVGVLDAVTSEMDPATFLNMLQYGCNSCLLVIQPNDIKSTSFALKGLNSVDFVYRTRKASMTRGHWLSNGQESSHLARVLRATHGT